MKAATLEHFLIAIDATDEGTIREMMGDDYIDTPGYYSQEKDNYESIFEFMELNMGRDELDRLIGWYENNRSKIFPCQE